VKVVFVDDDNDLSVLFRHIAESEGVETVVYTDGLKALRYLDTDQADIDVILLDLSLPILDGLTIAEQIRLNEEIHPTRRPVDIAFITGCEVDATVQNVADRVGVRKIYQKPYDLEKLIQEVKTWRT